MVKRSKQLEKAVEDLLNLHKLSYHRVSNYRCFKCGQVQNSKAAGFPDFFVYHPYILAIECKTGKGRLSKKQKKVKRKMERSGIEYLVVRDNVDLLIKKIKERTKK